MNHIFQTSVLRSEAANQPFLYWSEWNISLSLWVSLNMLVFEMKKVCVFKDYLCYVAYYSLLDPNIAFIYGKDNP